MVVLVEIFLVPVDAGEESCIFVLLLGGGGDEVGHIALHHLD